MAVMTAEQVEQEVFEVEGVQVTILASEQASYRSYRALYPKRLGDEATVGQLEDRIAQAASGTAFGIRNPLGSPHALSSGCVLGNLRLWWPQPKPKGRLRRLAEFLRDILRFSWPAH